VLLKNLYDSHVHLIPTGQVKSALDLSKLKSPEEVSKLQIKPENIHGDWLIGFGWDENDWSSQVPFDRFFLDQYFPHQKVYFSRCDGHSGATNTMGLHALGFSLEDPAAGAGLLREAPHYQALRSLPEPSDSDLRDWLLVACQQFNQAGYTHVREMGGSQRLWKIAKDLESQNLQTLHIDWNFSCENKVDGMRALAEAKECLKQESPLNRVAGVKLFFDGSLGSETAYLSQPYANRNDGGRGQTCWPIEDLEFTLRQVWEAGLPMAIHTIGDEAVDQIVTLARKVSASGLSGRLNLEHVQVLRPDTLQKMKPLHITCHLQPCHWLSDRLWLKDKLGELYRYAFPWEALRKVKIPFFFGSDSPIEPPSLWNNLKALQDSPAFGIPSLGEDPLKFHVHPSGGGAQGETKLADGKVLEIFLQGRLIFNEN